MSSTEGGAPEPKKFTPRFIAPRGKTVTTTGIPGTASLPEPEERRAKIDISKNKDEIFQIKPDIIDYETEYLSNDVQKDPLYNVLFSFPTDDIEVFTEKRNLRTLETTLPKDAFDISVDPPYLKDCVDFYKMDWSKVRRKYEEPPTNSTLTRSQLLPRKLEIELPLEDETPNAAPTENVDADDIDRSLFGEYKGGETDQNNTAQRQQGRISLFQLVPADPQNIKPPKKAYPLVEQLGRQVLVEVKKLTFAIGEIEPFFGILAVYDIVKKRRITENFYFDLNADEVAKLMDEHHPQKDAVTLAKKALFSISEPSADLFVVLRIEKVLQGDLDAVTEPYMKQSSLKEKEKEKLKSVVPSFCSRLGKYRQPFCWGMIPLFNEDCTGLAGGENTEFKPLYKQKPTDISDEKFLEIINEYTKTGSSKRNKTIPGSCIVDLVEVNKPLSGAVTPSLVPVVPADVTQTIREIQEFKQASSVSSPFVSYVNNLYVYPESLNLNNRGGSVGARNLAIKVQLLESDENLNNEGLLAIYGRSSSAALQTYGLSSVTYHNKTPQFYDEFKIKLPLQLTEKHHLLFTFYHVACQNKANKPTAEAPETPVGYAVLPVYPGQRIVDKEHSLPVALELAPKYLSPEVESSLKYCDNKKPLFKLRVEVVSTVYPTDKHLNNFLLACRRNDSKLSKSLQSLSKLKPHTVIKFLPILFNELFRVMCSNTGEEAEVFIVLNQLLESVYHGFTSISEPTALLTSYIEYVFQNPPTPVYLYEELCKNWLNVMKKSKDNEQCVKFSWFLFRVMYKSMVLKLQAKGELDQKVPRKTRFSAHFINTLKELIGLLTAEIQQRSKTGVNVAKELNKSLALFLRNCYAIVDRGLTFHLIDQIVREITQGHDSETLVEFKFDFITLVCDYEFYVNLNLPVALNLGVTTDLMETLSKKHFLVGLVLKQVSMYLSHKDKAIRSKALISMKALLRRHNLDLRYQDKPARERIAGMYFPFILSILDHMEALKEFDFDEKRNVFLCALYILRTMNPHVIAQWIRKETQVRVVSFFDMLCQCSETFEYVGEDRWIEKMRETKSSKTREAKTVLENYYSESAKATPLSKYRSLREKRAAARKQSDADSLKNLSLTGSTSTIGTVGSTASNTGTTGTTGTLGSSTGTGRFGRGLSLTTPKTNSEFDEVLELNLSSEVSFTLLDLLECIVSEFAQELKNARVWTPNSLLDNTFKLWVNLFQRNQTQVFLSSLYASSRALVAKFSEQLFQLNNSAIAEICLEVVKHCNYASDITRKEATAFLYLLMKKNYEQDKKSFTRVKVQTTIALSKLVGKGLKSDAYLRRALGTISKFVLTEYPEKKGNTLENIFARQVEELSGRLHTILRDSIKINQHSADPEMMADLYFRIAKGYTNAPDLRVAWLESLANFNAKYKNFAEAAMCLIHIAALVAEYLSRTESVPGLPKGCAAFEKISRNVLEEGSIADLSSFGEGLADSKSQIFTENGLLKLLSDAIEFLKQGELFETANEVYKLMIPVFEKNRDYDKLSKAHGDLKEIFGRIMLSIQSQSRLLGSYYRVGLYGTLFEELDGVEFIYKEPKITRLGEIKERLTVIFATRFKSEDKVQFLTDSNVVDRSKLNSELAYIQITSVQPYFEPWEIKERVTYFDRNTNLNQFIFSSPFTLGAKSQADSVKDQYKRKTILSVENHFPYVKKRILIASKQEITLTPIENSIEIMEGRVDAILSEIRTQMPNTKTLHPVLQGSLLAAVNAGPKEICANFLGKNANEYPPDQVEKLQHTFKEFLKACEDALAVNKTLIGPDQVDFHKELELGYRDLKSLVETYL